jgi:hypothetical protein
MNLMPFAIGWAVLGVVVFALALVRRKLVEGEDDTIKLGDGEVGDVAKQKVLASKLSTVEMWGKSLTILLVATGLGLGLWYGMQLWDATSTAGMR